MANPVRQKATLLRPLSRAGVALPTTVVVPPVIIQTFQRSDIGPKYDLALATRDGSTLPCLDDNGNIQNLSQVAYMFSTTQGDQTESTDLVQKDQLTRLSSANVIDREFTLYPQVTQGDWRGGELQRVFVDPASYYQGRGLIWPFSATAPSRPVLTNQIIAGAGTWPGVVAGGFYTGIGAGYAVAYTRASVWRIAFYGATNTESQAMPAQIVSMLVTTGKIFFTVVGLNFLYTLSGLNPGNAAFATPTIAAGAGQLAAGIVGSTTYVAINLGSTINIYDANNAANFTTVTLPANLTFQSMAFLGSQLVIALSDNFNGVILGYDIPSATTTTIAQIQGYSSLQIAAVSGVIFIAAVSNNNQSVDCYLLVGSSLQLITTIPSQIAGVSAVTYQATGAITNVVSFGPYACFSMSLGGASNAVYAYDVQRGALFQLTDVLFGGPTGSNQLAVTTGLTAASPTGVIAQWTLIYQPSGGVASVATLLSFGVALGGATLINSGRIISSAIDFSSASLKLFRQLVITHVPVPTGGSFYASVWLDQDVDNLNATPDFFIPNNTAGSSNTRLMINKVARKLVYLLDYVTGTTTSNAPRPKTVQIQAATGWIWKVHLALSNLARLNGQQANAFCFPTQGIDEKAAYNFVRQLWRQWGGQCKATLIDGDTYNAVIESATFASQKFLALSMSGDRKTRYESVATVTLREDA